MASAEIVRQFIKAVVNGDMDLFDFLLRSDSVLEVSKGPHQKIYWTRMHVRNALYLEAANWAKPLLQLSVQETAADQFRLSFMVMVSENGRLSQRSYVINLTMRDKQIEMLDLASPAADVQQARAWVLPLQIPMATEKEVA